MSNFKIGQKVVYIGPSKHPEFVEPKKHEIITISGFSQVFNSSVYITEYPHSTKGARQSFALKSIRPLDHQFAEDVLAKIAELAKQDELVILAYE